MEDECDNDKPRYSVLKIEGKSAAELEASINKLVSEDWVLEVATANGNVLLFEKHFNQGRRRHRKDDGAKIRTLERALRDAHLTLLERDKQLDPESIKHWDSLRAERDQLRDAFANQNLLLHRLAEALIWASGAQDFAPGGLAADGWETVARPALEAYRNREDRDFDPL